MPRALPVSHGTLLGPFRAGLGAGGGPAASVQPAGPLTLPPRTGSSLDGEDGTAAPAAQPGWGKGSPGSQLCPEHSCPADPSPSTGSLGAEGRLAGCTDRVSWLPLAFPTDPGARAGPGHCGEALPAFRALPCPACCCLPFAQCQWSVSCPHFLPPPAVGIGPVPALALGDGGPIFVPTEGTVSARCHWELGRRGPGSLPRAGSQSSSFCGGPGPMPLGARWAGGLRLWKVPSEPC